MRRILALTLGSCLFLAPSAAASGLSAESFGTSGPSSLSGQLVALTTGDRADQAWTIVSLEGSATRIHAVIERMPSSLSAAGASVSAQQAPETETHEFDSAKLTWIEGGPQDFLLAWAPRGATVSASSERLHVAPGAAGSVHEPLKQGPSESVSVSVDGAYEAAGVVESLVIRGHVRVAVHDAHLRVEHSGGTEDLDVRSRQDAPVPGVPLERSQSSYAYLTLEDAVVTLRPAGEVPAGALFVGQPRLDSFSLLIAHQAEGTAFGLAIGTGGPADAAFYGEVTAGLDAPADGKGVAHFEGDPESIVVAGQAMDLGERGRTSTLQVASLLFLGLLILMGGVWNASPSQRVRRLERRLAQGDVERVVTTGGRLFATRAGDRARLAVTVALLRQRRAAPALHVLSGARAVTAPTRLLLEAQAAAILNDPHVARAKAEACLKLAPAMRTQILAMGDLAPLLRDGGGYA